MAAAMAKSLQTLPAYLFAVLIVLVTLPSIVHGQTNGTFVNQSEYSNFELFKNTGLQPCPIIANTTAPATSSLVPRSPRGGGRGGGGGGGSRSGSSVAQLVQSRWIGSQEVSCLYMRATPIMIPTTPTQYAFMPWWPTFSMQFITLLVSFAGLWWTARSVEKNPHVYDRKLPITFWIQLPIDMARIAAWFVKAFMGFSSSKRFSWISVVMWLLAFNYIWLMKFLGERRSDVAVHQTVPQQEKFQMQEPGVVEYNDQQQGVPSTRKSRISLVWILFGLIAIVQWLVTIGVVGTHFKYSWSSRSKHPTYLKSDRAISDPSSLGPMPQTCLDWLQKAANSAATNFHGIHDKQSVQMIQAAIAVVQFILCTIIAGSSLIGNRSVFTKLKISAIALFITLALPAVGTGAWIAAKGEQDTYLTYTTNSTLTGGCTFGAMTMNKQWGYWDVKDGIAPRIVLSLLGVA
ncbi:hypothetical protein BKA66DRAFT_602642 [Pyrenochaeta sp. MPI-SDFR-AT-0127]|nr:hypothetical protein BKA66DRAFT_602642 [Pyrenochaeta sp. MPI-SDFR-AT-0127]